MTLPQSILAGFAFLWVLCAFTGWRNSYLEGYDLDDVALASFIVASTASTSGVIIVSIIVTVSEAIS